MRASSRGPIGYKARGEGSTSQTNPNRVSYAAQRLFDALPDCQLIYMVRHPLRRLESDWKLRSHYGSGPCPSPRP